MWFGIRLLWGFGVKSLFGFSLFLLIFFCLDFVCSWYGFCWLGLDRVSQLFVLLTSFIVPICMVSCWVSRFKVYGILVCVEVLLLGLFSIDNLLGFYIIYEAIMIPMFIWIGVSGTRFRRIKASSYFIAYTLLGSLFLLASVLTINVLVGSLDYGVLLLYDFEVGIGRAIWFLLFIGFMTKVPMVPFHVWLPEAHVEASTEGSVILASLLLKLGGYGLIRYNVLLLGEFMDYFGGLVGVVGVVGVLHSSLVAVRQTDLKRVIAYSSVAHMGVTVVGLIVGDVIGYIGSVYQMVSHGLVSGGLFLCVGVLYSRIHQREVWYYGGLVAVMPVYSIVLFLFILGNIGFPGTSSFVGEFMLLVGVVDYSLYLGLWLTSSVAVGSAYSLWLYSRVCFGNVYYAVEDLTYRELAMLMPVLFLTLIFGLCPGFVLLGLL